MASASRASKSGSHPSPGAPGQHYLRNRLLGTDRRGAGRDLTDYTGRCPNKPPRLTLGVQDKRVRRQVVDGFGVAALCEIGRAGAKPQRDCADLSGDEFGIVQRTDADRDIDVLGRQIDRAVIDGQHQAYIGVARQKRLEHWRERARREGEADADPQRPYGFSNQPADGVFRLGDVIEDSRGVPT